MPEPKLLHCDGCDEDRDDVAPYLVTFHDGQAAKVAYCADCAALAKVDWNGETASIFSLRFPIRLIQMVEGRMVRTDFGPEADLISAMAIRGYDYIGPNRNPHQRVELQSAPKFSGLNGPMWDGNAIRYEDQRSYTALSE